MIAVFPTLAERLGNEKRSRFKYLLDLDTFLKCLNWEKKHVLNFKALTTLDQKIKQKNLISFLDKLLQFRRDY